MLQDSEYFRVHQEIAISTFRTKSSDLYLSQPFLTFLHNLPLDYNYALYRQIFQQFGTHYFSSGTLGGQYELLFQYDREQLKTQGILHTGMAWSYSSINSLSCSFTLIICYCQVFHRSRRKAAFKKNFLFKSSFILQVQVAIDVVRTHRPPDMKVNNQHHLHQTSFVIIHLHA